MKGTERNHKNNMCMSMMNRMARMDMQSKLKSHVCDSLVPTV